MVLERNFNWWFFTVEKELIFDSSTRCILYRIHRLHQRAYPEMQKQVKKEF